MNDTLNDEERVDSGRLHRLDGDALDAIAIGTTRSGVNDERRQNPSPNR
jgi:hypothetical protein